MPEGRLQRTREAYADPWAELARWKKQGGGFLVPPEFSTPLQAGLPVAPARFYTDSDPGDETENLWGV